MDTPWRYTLKKKAQKVTTRPGVYLYFDSAGTVIYVGKAKNLKSRILQYFSGHNTQEEKTQHLVSQIVSFQTLPTDTEFNALLLEAAMIRKYQPKYNSIAKDDKSPVYIAIPFDERLPRVLFIRKKEIDSWKTLPKRRFIAGPFQSARVAKTLMRTVRRIIPYCMQSRRDGNPCFYTHIGLCNPCPSEILTSDRVRIYRTNLRRIALLLSGQAHRVRRQIERAMHTSADQLSFEEAAAYKRQLDALTLLQRHTFDPATFADQSMDRLNDLSRILNIACLDRIECIDSSAIGGAWATGSLVVFTRGVPDTDAYRRFRIKKTGKANDVGMIDEVIKRRFSHPEWPNPNLLVVDGGKGQVRGAVRTVKEIPVIGLAKRFETVVIPVGNTFRIIRIPRNRPALHLLQHIRDEAHRFAKKYHVHLRAAYEFATMKQP